MGDPALRPKQQRYCRNCGDVDIVTTAMHARGGIAASSVVALRSIISFIRFPSADHRPELDVASGCAINHNGFAAANSHCSYAGYGNFGLID